MESWSYDSVWPADAASVAAARRFVASRLEFHHLLDAVAHAQLVVSELASNAVRHAGTPFVVTLAHREEALVLSVRDAGAGMPHAHLANPLAEHGRGLLMVSRFSDAWGVTPCSGGGKEVWATFQTTSS